MPNMPINIDRRIEYVILIKFKYNIQFVMFRRGHLVTPIDAAPVLISGKPCSTNRSPPETKSRIPESVRPDSETNRRRSDAGQKEPEGNFSCFYKPFISQGDVREQD